MRTESLSDFDILFFFFFFFFFFSFSTLEQCRNACDDTGQRSCFVHVHAVRGEGGLKANAQRNTKILSPQTIYRSSSESDDTDDDEHIDTTLSSEAAEL